MPSVNLAWLQAMRDALQEGLLLPGIIQGSCMVPVSPSVATTASVWFPSIPADYEQVRAWQLAHAQDTVSPPSSIGPCNAEEWGKMFTVVVQVSAKWDLFLPRVKSCCVSEGVLCARRGGHRTA